MLNDILDPKKVKPFLITASLYITAFEMLKDSINKRIEEFFLVNQKCRNHNFRKEYEEDMQPYLAAHKDVRDKKTYAHLDWLIDVGAITKEDIVQYDRVRTFRNDIAHEMTNLLNAEYEKIFREMNELFIIMLKLITKIERFWMINVEIPCNPEFDGQEINHEEITPGTVLLMQMLVETALNDK